MEKDYTIVSTTHIYFYINYRALELAPIYIYICKDVCKNTCYRAVIVIQRHIKGIVTRCFLYINTCTLA